MVIVQFSIYFRPTLKLREGNVFSVSVHHSVREEGVPMVTITHEALNLTVQGPLLQHETWTPGLSPFHLLVTSDSNYWRPGQTCSLENPPTLPVLTSGGMLTEVHTVGSGQYASYWNAFLFTLSSRDEDERHGV